MQTCRAGSPKLLTLYLPQQESRQLEILVRFRCQQNRDDSKFTRVSELNIYTAIIALTAPRNNVYSKDFRRFCAQ
jgi:hypothetical protein